MEDPEMHGVHVLVVAKVRRHEAVHKIGIPCIEVKMFPMIIE
jgi:hypothetical protein